MRKPPSALLAALWLIAAAASAQLDDKPDAQGAPADGSSPPPSVAPDKHLEYNPKSRDGIYGRLRKTSRDSRLLDKDADMADEEQRELLRSMFEGQGSQSNKITTVQEKAAAGAATAAAALNYGYYDRLSRGNLRGYSPDLAAMQSALNARRAPGAPKLIETGKLDYATLSYPGYGMRYDVALLERRLRAERNWSLAKALGLTSGLTADRLLDPALEAELLAKAAAAKIGPSARYTRRAATLQRAAEATRNFDQAALAAKDPARISRDLLAALSGRQREAARWITAASLEEELDRLETALDFLSPELLGVIARCPVSADDQAAYRRRGEDYGKRLRALKGNDEQAVVLLESDRWAAEIASVEKLLSENAALRKDLSSGIDDYVQAAYRFSATSAPKPRWQEALDSLVLRLAPATAYGKRLAAAAKEKERLKDVFLKIAMGDVEAAHAILAASAPTVK